MESSNRVSYLPENMQKTDYRRKSYESFRSASDVSDQNNFVIQGKN